MRIPELDLNEVCRYLGYRGTTPDLHTAQEIVRCIGELQAVVQAKTVVQQYPFFMDNENRLCFAETSFQSEKLAEHLSGCTEIALFAATLGLSVDRLISKRQLTGIADAAILDAAATAMVEALCDETEAEIRQAARARGLTVRTRFSPGYGDLPLETQSTFLAILQAGKTCGITLTDGGMMMPSKSVTALVGIGAETPDKQKDRCAACGHTACAFRNKEAEDRCVANDS